MAVKLKPAGKVLIIVAVVGAGILGVKCPPLGRRWLVPGFERPSHCAQRSIGTAWQDFSRVAAGGGFRPSSVFSGRPKICGDVRIWHGLSGVL